MTRFDTNVLMNAAAFVRRSAIVQRFAERAGCASTSYSATIACSYIYENAATGRRMNRTSIMRAIEHLVSRSTGYRITARLLAAGWLAEDGGYLVATPAFLEEFECFINNLAILGRKSLAFEQGDDLFDCTLWYDAESFEYLFAENTEDHMGWGIRDLIGRQMGVLGHPGFVQPESYGFATCVRAVPGLPAGSVVMSTCVARHKLSGDPVFFSARLSGGTMGAKRAVVAQIKVINQTDWIASTDGRPPPSSQFETTSL